MTSGAPHRHQGWYLFGIFPPDSDIDAAGWPSFGGNAAVHVVRAANMFAVVARIPLEDFPGADATPDPERLTELVRDHDLVLRKVAACGRALVPAPFGTVTSDLDELRRLVEDHCQELYDALSRLEGCDEWGVHVSVSRETSQLAVRRLTREVYDGLAACAEDAVIEPVEAAANEDRPSALSAAFLVNRDRFEQFEATLRELRGYWEMAGGSITLSGPWPGYHFARVDLGTMSRQDAMVLLGPLSAPERAWVT